MDIKQDLQYVINKHKNDKLQTFDTNITAMAEDCLRKIRQLEERLEVEYEGGYMDGFKYVVDLIEGFHATEGEKLNLSFEEFVILESLLDYIKKCR